MKSTELLLKRRGQFKPDPGQSTTNNTNTNTSSTNVLGGGLVQ